MAGPLIDLVRVHPDAEVPAYATAGANGFDLCAWWTGPELFKVQDMLADGRVCNVPYDPSLPVHTVWDLGWNDAMTISMVQVGPFDVRVIDYI